MDAIGGPWAHHFTCLDCESIYVAQRVSKKILFGPRAILIFYFFHYDFASHNFLHFVSRKFYSLTS